MEANDRRNRADHVACGGKLNVVVEEEGTRAGSRARITFTPGVRDRGTSRKRSVRGGSLLCRPAGLRQHDEGERGGARNVGMDIARKTEARRKLRAPRNG